MHQQTISSARSFTLRSPAFHLHVHHQACSPRALMTHKKPICICDRAYSTRYAVQSRFNSSTGYGFTSILFNSSFMGSDVLYDHMYHPRQKLQKHQCKYLHSNNPSRSQLRSNNSIIMASAKENHAETSLNIEMDIASSSKSSNRIAFLNSSSASIPLDPIVAANIDTRVLDSDEEDPLADDRNVPHNADFDNTNQGGGGGLQQQLVQKQQKQQDTEPLISRKEIIQGVKYYAGKPEIVQVLQRASKRSDVDLGSLVTNCFAHPLDDFQASAIQALNNQKNVVVSAPTGSGKTVIGEGAIYLALAHGKRAFYTSPLKALSNQKFFDFKKQFGENRVGLLTGDASVNRNADIVVMTTEVYRNILFACETGENVGGLDAHKDDQIKNLYAVVFDEFHFMNNKDRGTVWEESVISTPSHVRLVALSATIANTLDVEEWFSSVHGPTKLCYSDFRPVPLRFAFATKDQIVKLFKTDSQTDADVLKRKQLLQLNPRLILKSKPKYPKNGKTSTTNPKDCPTFGFIAKTLREKQMLPAIIFVFSRKGCERVAAQLAEQEPNLLTAEEKARIAEKLEKFQQEQPVIVSPDRMLLALQGVASHHAGILPIWKAIVEELFQEGLLKIVVATETLAAGINMPARTTVISALQKRAGEQGIVQLSTSDLLQMAGRAGRRGKDKVGYAVIMQSVNDGPESAFNVLRKNVDPLISQFSPGYGMVLSLLAKRSPNECRDFLEKTFGTFMKRKERKNQETYKSLLDDIDKDEIEKYEKLLENVKNEIALFNNLLVESAYGSAKNTLSGGDIEERRAKIDYLKTEIKNTTFYGLEKRSEILAQYRSLKLNGFEIGNSVIKNGLWQDFCNITDVLREFGFLEGTTVTALGQLGISVRSENELWTVLVLTHPAIKDINPEEFAGVLSAILTENAKADEEAIEETFASERVIQVCQELSQIEQKLLECQDRHNVDIPVNMNLNSVGLIEQWAKGAKWGDLLMMTPLQEGDLCRRIRRVMEVLEQIKHIAIIPDVVKKNAKLAIAKMDRFPVTDDVTFSIGPHGPLAQEESEDFEKEMNVVVDKDVDTFVDEEMLSAVTSSAHEEEELDIDGDEDLLPRRLDRELIVNSDTDDGEDFVLRDFDDDDDIDSENDVGDEDEDDSVGNDDEIIEDPRKNLGSKDLIIEF